MLTKPITLTQQFVVIVPAAGVGKRMLANCPKQYLTIDNKTILEHTVERLLSHPLVNKVIIALSGNDEYFPRTSLVNNQNIQTVIGGKERVDSVLAGLKVIDTECYAWVLVHDAARPCVCHDDISNLMKACIEKQTGGLLASPVRDTMKRSFSGDLAEHQVLKTVVRENLWHALTPQMFKVKALKEAIINGLSQDADITDESSAIEFANVPSLLVWASSENIKITHPDDLALAAFFLAKQKQQQQKHKLQENA
ncbi:MULTISPECIES: 2-C-methyl-D-erythritol 4-phosphate cytidylyltransferase [unclassified Colwellia]|uniref:2-C-methyl-D-erythritol 4-phosphate cytidylyltransferase n=1 Tax=unclassified Colwellia TaxID=196834 RepID=UPI0015F4D927|nr:MULTISPECIES: 2-C-methyl-D-erythritol 4-phosphate cytidylyltransferase [unclassified Colwellia]MBA6232444.1 2-C-methyl-D-erythritol 4-phosphate cytidylyltransferase [Colwellia sp. MB02u-7]MBA6238301.1 2-C-methyl-D-erythritol 4-phosphate cytidylyltransferase [Colwellia sp. MB02u-11]MBA6254551.1 2-C-methyl-D-erythritol 4-phosphate cytidylyltransferase [Colwellia sp. MB3u-28]MBA6258278.1 2-C-methyl-D-erythritol 4-phosphate cytidylyltransferase [Colwellia sp. MB3u-41]MBA6301051.1 2-C-methyl-D-e